MKITPAKAKKIPVPEGPGWPYVRHLANSRVMVTAATVQGLCEVSLERAGALLREAATEDMGWFNETGEGQWVGRL
jgi:hypothetical protein